MEKIICDVCGIAYPETAAQCPICGCARSDSGQTSACDTVEVEEEAAYAATKGGRFSKNNVRKRLKAAQIQPIPMEIPPRSAKKSEPVEEPEDEDYQDYEEDDEEEVPTSNKGLVIVVVLLLLAIIAVSSYIAIEYFDIFGSDKPTQGVKDPVLSTQATDPTQAPDPTDPTEPSEPDNTIPCTKVNVDATMTLGKDLPTMQLTYSVEPIDTTDYVKFFSSDTSVATVDSSGCVTAHSTGYATIYLTCGKLTAACSVICDMDEEIPDDEPMPDLQLRMTDATLIAKDYQWRAYKQIEGFDATKFTWTMDDESVATVKDGFVTSVAPGRTTMRVYYKGELVATCVIRCIWTEGPEVPDDPENPDEPTDPVEVNYLLKINNANPTYKYNNQDNSAEVTQAVGQKFRLTLVEKELSQIMNDVVWTISDETVCKMDGDYVVVLKKGTCKITCEYNGVTYLVFVRVTK